MFVTNALKNDAKTILRLIKEKAEFDGRMGGISYEVTTSLEKIERTLFGQDKCAHALLAINNEREVIGFTLYHTRYSSFTGHPSIWLDDLYVTRSKRSLGFGLKMINEIKQRATEVSASHIAWTASVTNTRGQDFYNRLGAKIDRSDETLIYYRLVL
jgi:GNAT superfamily N-acetyltransferase